MVKSGLEDEKSKKKRKILKKIEKHRKNVEITKKINTRDITPHKPPRENVKPKFGRTPPAAPADVIFSFGLVGARKIVPGRPLLSLATSARTILAEKLA